MAKESADVLRKRAQEMLRKAAAQEKEELLQTKVKLGQLLQNYLEKKVTLAEFKAGVKSITGMSFVLSAGAEVPGESA